MGATLDTRERRGKGEEFEGRESQIREDTGKENL